jgi:hypothetical protein
MKKALMLLVLLTLTATSAYATSNNGNNNGQGGNASASASASAESRNSNTNLNANTNHNAQMQLQGQMQSTKNSNNASQSTNLTVQGDDYDIPVSTAYAPSIAPTANCALSVSGGVQVMGFGGSFGKAYIDENCAALEAVRSVSQVLGDKATAEALMCQNPKYAKARATAGRPCAVEQE